MKAILTTLVLLASTTAMAQSFDLGDVFERIGRGDRGDRGGRGGRDRVETVLCESHDYRYNTCRVGRIRDAYLAREISRKSPCIEGETFGFERNYIWVDAGRRGEFRIVR